LGGVNTEGTVTGGTAATGGAAVGVAQPASTAAATAITAQRALYNLEKLTDSKKVVLIYIELS
jgi:hypothetical protein